MGTSRTLLTAALLVSCGVPPTLPVVAGERPLEVTIIDAGCTVTVEKWATGVGTHVLVGTALTWPSNPPSSGPHFPVWAAFEEFSSAVPRGHYVHDLEHGAVVFLYDCSKLNDCAAAVDVLRQASDALPRDPSCASPVRVRTVISPDPLLDDPIAAVAWGFVYRAQCADLASLKDFAATHYARAPEDVCANGVRTF